MKLPNLTLPKTTPSTPIKVYCDASRTEDDFSVAGWAYTDHNDGFLEKAGCDLGIEPSSIRAEMEAMRRSLEALNDYDDVQHVKVYTDCKPAYRNMDLDAWSEEFDSLTIKWIPREENTLADLIADYYLR